MGLFDSLVETAVNVVSTPINVVEDVLDGDITLSNTRKGVSDTAQSVADVVDDTMNGDL